MKSNEVIEPTKNQMVSTNDIASMVKHNGPNSFCMSKKAFDSFKYGSAIGYRAFLAWFMETGNYIQGDLAVWHWADVCRLFRNYDYNNFVILIIQNTEYVIVGTENISNQTIKFFKMRLEDVEKEIDRKSQSTPMVGNSL